MATWPRISLPSTCATRSTPSSVEGNTRAVMPNIARPDRSLGERTPIWLSANMIRLPSEWPPSLPEAMAEELSDEMIFVGWPGERECRPAAKPRTRRANARSFCRRRSR